MAYKTETLSRFILEFSNVLQKIDAHKSALNDLQKEVRGIEKQLRSLECDRRKYIKIFAANLKELKEES